MVEWAELVRTTWGRSKLFQGVKAELAATESASQPRKPKQGQRMRKSPCALATRTLPDEVSLLRYTTQLLLSGNSLLHMKLCAKQRCESRLKLMCNSSSSSSTNVVGPKQCRTKNGPMHEFEKQGWGHDGFHPSAHLTRQAKEECPGTKARKVRSCGINPPPKEPRSMPDYEEAATCSEVLKVKWDLGRCDQGSGKVGF